MTTETVNGHGGQLPAPPTRPPTQAEIDQAQAVLAAQQQAAAEAAAAQQLAQSARREIPIADLSHLAPVGQAPVAPAAVQQAVPVVQQAAPAVRVPVGTQHVQDLVPVQQAAGQPVTFGAWWSARKSKPKSVWQRRTQRAGAVVAGVAVAGVMVHAYMGRVADSRLSAAIAYIDGPVAEQTGDFVREQVAAEVAAQVQQAPKQLVTSDPLEKMLPCVLSGEAKRMIGADPTLGNTTLNQQVTASLAQQYRALSVQVLPQSLRIYDAGNGTVALSTDPTVGAALLDPATCGTGG